MLKKIWNSEWHHYPCSVEQASLRDFLVILKYSSVNYRHMTVLKFYKKILKKYFLVISLLVLMICILNYSSSINISIAFIVFVYSIQFNLFTKLIQTTKHVIQKRSSFIRNFREFPEIPSWKYTKGMVNMFLWLSLISWSIRFRISEI